MLTNQTLGLLGPLHVPTLISQSAPHPVHYLLECLDEPQISHDFMPDTTGLPSPPPESVSLVWYVMEGVGAGSFIHL